MSVLGAKIRSVSGGTPQPDGSAIGPAAGITYTVAVNTPEGTYDVPGVQPFWSRPTGADIQSARPNDTCLPVEVGDQTQFLIAEHFAIGDPCP